MSCPPSSKLFATATAISCCCGRYSKFGERESIPVGEKISSTCARRSILPLPDGCASRLLIIIGTNVTSLHPDSQPRSYERSHRLFPYALRGRSTTTSTSALFLAIMFAGRLPRQFTLG